ncbi:hypothetical protein ACOMHN_030559 [Nucella lapillus]
MPGLALSTPNTRRHASQSALCLGARLRVHPHSHSQGLGERGKATQRSFPHVNIVKDSVLIEKRSARDTKYRPAAR